MSYLKKITFGSGITSFAGYVIRNNTGLKEMIIKGNITSFFYSFYVYNLEKVIFKGTIAKNAWNEAFPGCPNILFYDFS